MARPVAGLAGALSEHLRHAARARPTDAAELEAVVDLLDRHRTGSSTVGRRAPSTVPGLRHLPLALSALDATPRSPLGAAVAPTVGQAAWSTFYARSEWSVPFVDELAVGVLIGPDGPRPATGFTLGLFLQGPHTVYPPHAHAAAEVYAVVAGEADFQSGAHVRSQPRPAGSVVVHPSELPHAITTGADPLLAVYAWRGEVAAPPWYRRDMADEAEPRLHPPLVV